MKSSCLYIHVIMYLHGFLTRNFFSWWAIFGRRYQNKSLKKINHHVYIVHDKLATCITTFRTESRTMLRHVKWEMAGWPPPPPPPPHYLPNVDGGKQTKQIWHQKMTTLLHLKINDGANKTKLIMVIIIILVLLQGQSPGVRSMTY